MCSPTTCPAASQHRGRDLPFSFYGVALLNLSLKVPSVEDLPADVESAVDDLERGRMEASPARQVVAQTSFRDLAIGAAALIREGQLIKGEATVITSDLERKKMHELLPKLIAEGRRRGFTIDGEFTQLTPQEPTKG